MKKYLPLFIISPLVVILDQITKFLIVKNLAIGDRIVVLSNYFDIVHLRNEGAAFSAFADWESTGRAWILYGASLLAMTALFFIYWKSKETERRIQIPLALIFGGAVGNLIDRLRYGNVVDFLRLHWHEKIVDFELFGNPFRVYLSWPAFNVADAAVTCGAILLVIVLLFFDTRREVNKL
jgi:signal peptidase II